MCLQPCCRAPRRARSYIAWSGLLQVRFWWRGRWRGISLPTWVVHVWVDGVPRPVESGGCSVMAKPPVRPAGAGSVSSCGKGDWAGSLVSLSEWLCDGVYDDGTLKGAVQLQLRREGTIVRATLKIADQGGLRISAVERDPASALLALDLLLGLHEAPWEVDEYPLGGKGLVKRK